MSSDVSRASASSDNSYRSDFSSALSSALDKKKCLEVLQTIIAVKREQAFCQSADKEIFMTNDRSVKSIDTKSVSHSQSAAAFSTCSDFSAAQTVATEKDQAKGEKSMNKLTTEEEVFLMNIDYFEQWDRIYQKFGFQEKQVLQAMK